MKPEPLTKEKIVKIGTTPSELLPLIQEKMVKTQNVKSAVDWALKEIEKEFNIFEDSYMFKDMENYYLERIPGEAWDKFRNEIFRKIKKAFEGAMR